MRSLILKVTSSSVCLLNTNARHFIPYPYTVITLLSFLHCSSQPFQYLSFPNRAQTRPWNKKQSETKTFTSLRRSQSKTQFFGQSSGSCKFRIKRKATNWLFWKDSKEAKLSQITCLKVKSLTIYFCIVYLDCIDIYSQSRCMLVAPEPTRIVTSFVPNHFIPRISQLCR